MKRTLRAFTGLAMAAVFTLPAYAQTDLGASCGCPAVGSRPTVALSTKADGLGNLTAANTILYCDTVYTLDDKIYVGDGKTITIHPGTLIKGAPGPVGDANALIVSRGGKIIAPGTEECPIVFTAAADPMNGTYGISNKGKWGGVVLLGKARNNLKGGFGPNTISDGVGFIEGFTSGEPRNEYGAAPGLEDNNDNSGIMTYVSIRHSGEIVGAANELNGLSLGSVGRGTTLQHIEIVSSLDDGIEFFGGNVDVKYASVLFNDDDGFDWDQGWAGKGQFWVVVKTDVTTAPGGDNGHECDADDGGQCTYYAVPKIYNCTFIGQDGINGVPTSGPNSMQAMQLKEATRGELRNSIYSNYISGVRFTNTALGTHKIDADGTGPGAPVDQEDSYKAWLTLGTLKVENNTFIGTTVPLRVDNAAGSASDLTKFAADGNTTIASLAGFSGLHNMNVSTNVVSTKHDLIPGANVGPVSTPPVDGFFTPVTYRGAFKTGEKSWLSDYTLNKLIGLEANLGTCSTDINTDGSTNTSDFLLLLGAFGTNCQ